MPAMTADDMEAQILTLQAEVRVLRLVLQETVADQTHASRERLKANVEAAQQETEKAAQPRDPRQTAHFGQVQQTLQGWWAIVDRRGRAQRQ